MIAIWPPKLSHLNAGEQQMGHPGDDYIFNNGVGFGRCSSELFDNSIVVCLGCFVIFIMLVQTTIAIATQLT